MSLFLHSSLCDLSKAAKTPSASDKGVGEQRGGNYYHRIQTGYSKDNAPSYRYFDTKEEFDSYSAGKGETAKQRTKKTGDESAKRLKDKTTKEQKESSAKQKDSLFIKDKDKKIKKSLFINLPEAS